MFCPQCGTNNSLEQKYCRQCGLLLSTIQLALDGRIDGAITLLRKGQKLLTISLIALVIFALVALVHVATGGRAGFTNLLSAVIMFVITLPFLVTGLIRFWRANKLLNAQNQSKILLSGQTGLPISKPPTEITKTENTTLKLKPPNQMS